MGRMPSDRASAEQRRALVKAAHDALFGPEPPACFGELAERLGVRPDARLAQVLDRTDFKRRAVHFRIKGKAATKKDAPIYPIEALERADVLQHVVQFVFEGIETAATHAFTVVQVGQKVSGKAGEVLRAVLEGLLGAGRVPPNVGVVEIRGRSYLFRLERMRAGEASEAIRRSEALRSTKAGSKDAAETARASDFAAAFDAAFDRLDAEGRNLNFVKLSDLRGALPEYDRETFDAELRSLRLAGRYELNAAEGSHRRLSDADRAAGIIEAGTRLVYCQRVR